MTLEWRYVRLRRDVSDVRTLLSPIGVCRRDCSAPCSIVCPENPQADWLEGRFARSVWYGGRLPFVCLCSLAGEYRHVQCWGNCHYLHDEQISTPVLLSLCACGLLASHSAGLPSSDDS